MLKLKPCCEHCEKSLPPESTDARICSYECTFCADCVDTLLMNVCPNCGGGFVPRPIRPVTQWRPGVCLASQPAVTERSVKQVDKEAHTNFASQIMSIAPEQR